MLKHKATLLAVPVALAFGLAACGDDDKNNNQNNNPPSSNTIVDVAVQNGSFTTLVGALQATGLDETLSGEGPFTVFAPTDAAFELLPSGLVASLDNDTLSAILTYHVVAGEVAASQVLGLSDAETLQGDAVDIAILGGTVVLDGRVQATSTDIMADNGIIHVIDSVLIPGEFPGTVVDALVASPRFSTLTGAVVRAGLAGALSDTMVAFTVFAPSDDAFGLLPDGVVASLDTATLGAVLKHHVLGAKVDAAAAIAADGNTVTTLQSTDVLVQVDSGSVILDGRAQVEYTDIETSNGIIHILDSVILPIDFPGTVVDALVAYPRFESLVGAVVQQDLAGTLSDTMGAGFTVFAPTNNAFAPVDLSSFTSDQLDSILTFHVLPEPKDAGAVTGAASHATVEGSDLPISGTTLNGQADITFVDINASNGIIHVIDGVLVPSL
jgi:uncharacterized surface protein with fasciclin (FAS1) repeats